MVDPRRKWKAFHQNIRIEHKQRDGECVVRGSRGFNYVVNPDEPSCECPDWQKREPDGGCKHILHVKMQQGEIDKPPSAKTNFGNPNARSSSTYSSRWDSISRQVRKRDNWTCQACGAKGGPVGDAKLHAHHITPKSKGGKDKPEEVIAVCHDCHEELHGHSIPSPTAHDSTEHNLSANELTKQIDTSKNKNTPPHQATSHEDRHLYPRPTSEELKKKQPPHQYGPALKELEPPRPTDQELRQYAPPVKHQNELLDDFIPYKPPELKISTTVSKSKNCSNGDTIGPGNHCASNTDISKNDQSRGIACTQGIEHRQRTTEQLPLNNGNSQEPHSTAKTNSSQSVRTNTNTTNISKYVDAILTGISNMILLWLPIEAIILIFSLTPPTIFRVFSITSIFALITIESYTSSEN